MKFANKNSLSEKARMSVKNRGQLQPYILLRRSDIYRMILIFIFFNLFGKWQRRRGYLKKITQNKEAAE
jgi:hypothetical protein